MVRGRLQVGGRRARGLRSPPEEPDGAHGPVRQGGDWGVRRPIPGDEEQARVRAGRSSACITGCQRSRPCRTSCSRTETWGGPH